MWCGSAGAGADGWADFVTNVMEINISYGEETGRRCVERKRAGGGERSGVSNNRGVREGGREEKGWTPSGRRARNKMMGQWSSARKGLGWLRRVGALRWRSVSQRVGIYPAQIRSGYLRCLVVARVMPRLPPQWL